MDRNVIIVIVIVIFVALGFALLSNMTGNVITGAVVGDKEMVVESEYFRIDDSDNSEEVNKNGTQNNSG